MNLFTKNKTVALLICIFLYVFACFVPTQAKAGVTIKIWDFPRWLEPGETVDRFVWITKKIAEFEKIYPNIKVELTKLTWQRGNEKLKIAAIGGNPPDIAPGTVPLLFIREGLVEPIDDYLSESDRNDYLKGALNAFKVNKKIYGWPWYMSGQLLYINNEIFEAAGVTLPTDKWDKAAFEDSLKQIKGYMASKKGHYPLGLYFQKDETANLPFLMIDGGEIFNDNAVFCGDSQKFIAGLSWVKSLADKELIPADSGGRNANDIWTAFAIEKRIAAASFGLWGIQALNNKFKMNFSVVGYPNDIRPFIGTSGYYVFKNSDKKKVEAAMKFASFLTNAQNQKDLYKYSQFPTRTSVGDIYAGQTHMSDAWRILSEGQTVLADARWSQMDEEFSAAVQESLLAKDNFLQTAQQKMSSAKERISKLSAVNSKTVSSDIQVGNYFTATLIFLTVVFAVIMFVSGQAHVVMIIPALGVLVLFLFYPLSQALVLAFRDYRLGEAGGFTLSNFIFAFKDPKFIKACQNTFLYTITVVPANTLCALIIATLIHGLSGKLKTFFKASYYLPGVASVVVLTMVWRYMFNTEVGFFNEVLAVFGLAPVGWLSDPDIAFWSVIISNIVKSPGGAMLIYMASMANIPKDLYEAAMLEGAGLFKQWLYVTVPLLRNTTAFLMITGTITALQVFAQVLMLTDGGPGISTQVVVHRVYTAAFRDFDFGLSSAMALILFVVILVITVIQKKMSHEEVDYVA